MDVLTDGDPPELPGWDVSVAPAGAAAGWWAVLVSNNTDKRTHRPLAVPPERPAVSPPSAARSAASFCRTNPSGALAGQAFLPRRRCDVGLTWATDGSRTPDAGPVSGRRTTFHLDGVPFPVTMDREPASEATWRATGTLVLRDGPSDERPVTFEVAAYDLPDLLSAWTTVPVATLLRHQEVWLAP